MTALPEVNACSTCFLTNTSNLTGPNLRIAVPGCPLSVLYIKKNSTVT